MRKNWSLYLPVSCQLSEPLSLTGLAPPTPPCHPRRPSTQPLVNKHLIRRQCAHNYKHTHIFKCNTTAAFFCFFHEEEEWKGWRPLARVKPIYTSIITFVFTEGHQNLSFLIPPSASSVHVTAGTKNHYPPFVIACTGKPQ